MSAEAGPVEGGGDRASWPTVHVLGVPVHPSHLTEAADRVLELVDREGPAYVCVRDVHGVIRCRDDSALLDIHRRAAMVTTDGMPLVWASQRAGHAGASRVYGPDLMLEVCARRMGELRHFLYGSTPDVLADLQARLEERFPGLVVAGVHSPPFRPLSDQEDAEERSLIRAARPHVVWIGLSTPKQERWMAANVDDLDGAVLIGVGAAFDFHAGRKSQAPPWIQRAGLEWLFRMLTEPGRLGRRYLTVVPRFLWLTLRERVGVAQDEFSAAKGNAATDTERPGT